MVTVNSTISILSQTVPEIIPVVQGDTGRSILFTLADFTIPNGATATYYIQKPSGAAVYNAATIDGNTITVDLTAQALAEYGDNYGQVRISDDGEIVTSFDFILLVKKFRGIDATESTSEMNIFDQAVQNAMAQIDNSLPHIVAPEFDSTATYAAGDYVIYAGYLYKFNSSHSGAWTGSDATAVLVVDEMGSGSGTGLTDAIKQALLQIAQKVAYIDDQGQTYYNALYDALYPADRTITYNLTHVSSSNNAATVLNGSSYTTTLAGTGSYTLNSVTVTMGGVDITSSVYTSGTITIPSVTGNIVITATAVLAATSISAVYTQGGTVYDDATLDSLKEDLVVTATYADSSTATIPSADYTLSGTLTEGTSTITVTYAGLTDTFDVTVTANPYWKILSIENDFVEGYCPGSTYSSAVDGYGYTNSSRCGYLAFDIAASPDYTYTFTLDNSSNFGVLGIDPDCLTAVANHTSISSYATTDSGWKSTGYSFTPTTEQLLRFQFRVTAATLIAAGATEFRIAREAVQ